MFIGGIRASRFSSAAEVPALDLSLVGEEIDKLLVHRFDPIGQPISPILVIDNSGEVVRQL